MVTNLLICMVAGSISAMIIAVLIVKAQQLGLVQNPVARSSHSVPTPTGGGIGVVAGALIGIVVAAYANPILLAVAGLAAVIALLGLIDDRWPLPARIRFPVQFAVIALAVWITGATGAIFGEGHPPFVTFPAALLLCVGGTWWLNLFNFMDGIDGLAAQQSIAMLGSAMLLSGNAHPAAVGDPLWWMMAVTATATVAFLSFNWPPAKIFMGDVGSTFLGFVIFAVAAMTMAAGWMTLPQWGILAVLFAADATVTLITRLLRGERVTEGHRSHAYQRLSRRWGGARPVTVAALAVNMVVLLPGALIFSGNEPASYVALSVFYIFFIALFCYLGAGRAESRD